jgi:hypothetical protein
MSCGVRWFGNVSRGGSAYEVMRIIARMSWLEMMIFVDFVCIKGAMLDGI